MQLLFLAEHTTLHVHSFMLECAFKIPKYMTVVPMNSDSGNRVDYCYEISMYVTSKDDTLRGNIYTEYYIQSVEDSCH